MTINKEEKKNIRKYTIHTGGGCNRNGHGDKGVDEQDRRTGAGRLLAEVARNGDHGTAGAGTCRLGLFRALAMHSGRSDEMAVQRQHNAVVEEAAASNVREI